MEGIWDNISSNMAELYTANIFGKTSKHERRKILRGWAHPKSSLYDLLAEGKPCAATDEPVESKGSVVSWATYGANLKDKA